MQGFADPCTKLCRDVKIPACFVQGSANPCTKRAGIATPGPEGHWASKDCREGAEEDNRRISGFFVSQVVIVPGRRVAKPQTANKQSIKGSKSCKRLAA